MDRVETIGSFFLFDDDLRRYSRLPKSEGPRSSPPGEDWGGPDADPGLQDLVWHDFTERRVVERRGQRLLLIQLTQPGDDQPRGVIAPIDPAPWPDDLILWSYGVHDRR